MAAPDERDHGVADEILLTDDQPRELGLEASGELGHATRIETRLFSDHLPAVSPRLEKYALIRSRSLPGMRLWFAASSAVCS